MTENSQIEQRDQILKIIQVAATQEKGSDLQEKLIDRILAPSNDPTNELK